MLYLPEELLSQICFHLQTSGDVSQQQDDKGKLQTLRAISLASKACNRAAQPNLYSALDLRFMPYENGTHLTRLRLFLRTILERPNFAPSLQRLHYDHLNDGSGDVETAQEPLDPELLTRCKEAADHVQLGQQLRDKLQAVLETYTTDAELTLVLCLCQNVRYLDFTAGMGHEESLTSSIVQEIATADSPSRLQFLSTLSELEVEHWDTEYTTPVKDLLGYLQLPSLRRFKGFAISCEAQYGLITSTVRSNLVHMHLSDSLVDHLGVANLLRCFPQLQTLDIRLGDSVRGAVQVAYDEMGGALQHYGANLRRFTYNTSDAFFVDGDDESESLGNLTRLTNLRFLSVPLSALVGVFDYSEDDSDTESSPEEPLLADILPSSLATLQVMNSGGENVNEWLDRQLERVLQEERLVELGQIVVQRGKKPSARRAEQFSECALKYGWDASQSNGFWFKVKKLSKQPEDLYDPPNPWRGYCPAAP